MLDDRKQSRSCAFFVHNGFVSWRRNGRLHERFVFSYHSRPASVTFNDALTPLALPRNVKNQVVPIVAVCGVVPTNQSLRKNVVVRFRRFLADNAMPSLKSYLVNKVNVAGKERKGKASHFDLWHVCEYLAKDEK